MNIEKNKKRKRNNIERGIKGREGERERPAPFYILDKTIQTLEIIQEGISTAEGRKVEKRYESARLAVL